jgi:hypothetical protein
MVTRFSQANASERGIKNALAQFLDKRRVDVGYEVMHQLYLEENIAGVPQKRLIEQIENRTGLKEKRLRRTIADLLRIGAIRDIGSVRSIRIYKPALQGLQSSLGTLGSELERIDKGMKKSLKDA